MDAVNDTDRELLRRIWIEADRKPTAFVCIDTEFTSNGICELGIATRQKGTRTVSCHFIVNNNRGLRQKIPRPCTYGNSEEVPNHYALCPHLDNAFGLARRFNQVVVLVGHDVQNDIRNLKQFCHWDIPPEVIILDTLRIWRAWINIQERGNLEQALSFFNIETKPGELHNAGNDAHYTMELLFRQANQAFHFPERMSPTVPEVRVRQRPVRPIRLDKKLDKKSRVKRRCDLELSRRAPSPESPTHRSKRRRVFDDADLRGFDVVFQQGPIKANGLQKGPNTLNFLDDVFVDQGPSQKTIFNNGNGFAQGAGTQQPPKYPASAREARAWAREVRAQEHDFGYPFSSPKAQPDFIDLTNDTPPWKCAGELIDLTNDTPPRKNGADVIDLARDPPPPWPAGVFQFGQKDGLQSTPKGGQFDFQAMMDQEEIKNQEAMKDHEEMKNQEEMKPVVDQKARGLGSRIMSCLTRLSPFGAAQQVLISETAATRDVPVPSPGP
ncbi:hypothetical protein GE09DRAFT_1228557 [Coniochaeta sp. 2T2.1]|nr:hypothetical protein GE09DRAFT_1228557 [Coniochaeta sp. 2T2.1]